MGDISDDSEDIIWEDGDDGNDEQPFIEIELAKTDGSGGKPPTQRKRRKKSLPFTVSDHELAIKKHKQELTKWVQNLYNDTLLLKDDYLVSYVVSLVPDHLQSRPSFVSITEHVVKLMNWFLSAFRICQGINLQADLTDNY